MRREAAQSPGHDESTTHLMNDENMTVTASRREAREGHMYTQSSTHPVRRLVLGVVLAALALTVAPTLVDQYAAQPPQPVVRESAAVPTAPEGGAQEAATQAPAAFSDALAAAPAGAQCSVEAHACTVPGAGGETAMSSNETAVAYGFSQTLRGASHNQRM